LNNSNAVSVFYKKLVRAGKVNEDLGQINVINALDDLYNQVSSKTYFNNIFSDNKNMGVYIFGKVGRGKSYLMDIFYKLVQYKRCMRVHQHDFMKHIYEYMKQGRSLNNKDPLKYAVDKYTKKIHLLCIDEFEVLDVADAMILERIYNLLFKKNIKVVLTSNTSPSDLYKNGLQRIRFVPFINLVENFMIISEVLAGKDYRIKISKKKGMHEFQDFYYLPSNTKLCLNLFNFLRNKFPVDSIDLEYNKRKLKIEKIANRVAIFSFSNLCEDNLSIIDYYQIITKCDWIILTNIPELTSKHRNEAKRFQILIDILYDKKIGLALSSDVKPEDIYIAGDGYKEFRRTISRIYEMTDKDWLNKINNKNFKNLFSL
jgi:cell division protein ZapE